MGTKAAEKALDDMVKQTLFAASKALNAVAAVARDTIRDSLPLHFQIRNAWTAKGSQILERSTKDRLATMLGILPLQDYLSTFEDGGFKRPTRAKTVAAPGAVKRNKRDIISKRNRPRALLARLDIPR